MNIEAGIWKCENGKWYIHKMYKGESWENIDFSYEHKTACPVCSIYGALKYERCW